MEAAGLPVTTWRALALDETSPAKAIGYALNQRVALQRFLDDGVPPGGGSDHPEFFGPVEARKFAPQLCRWATSVRQNSTPRNRSNRGRRLKPCFEPRATDPDPNPGIPDRETKPISSPPPKVGTDLTQTPWN